ncbi:zinc finger protein 26-like [Paramacrobiotus metropolitanus]|uniref:zinc finger protein 26-like n=1 Tax=Paramacrobiotus metropolitanus TaxID=2943436 RepID=UPI00244606FF|nr:zinc finger protein 26-like [Paramacrobiotus metropolitanus]XP_055334318.1 zinc finger protein 26-like [Paramacrobiotus metropolitanus]
MAVSQYCEPLEQIFCNECLKWTTVPCVSHAERIPDTMVFPYAMASLPSVLYLDIPSDGQSDKAVFAKEPIRSQTVFGPFVSALNVDKPADAAFACGSASQEGLHYFHTESNQTTNWMKFVRFARNATEQNLAAFEVHEDSLLLTPSDAVSPTRTHVIFISTKVVLPGEELKVAYSLVYSQTIASAERQSAHPTEPMMAAEPCGQENKDSSATVTKRVKPRSQLGPIQIGSIKAVRKLLSMPRNTGPNPVQHEPGLGTGQKLSTNSSGAETVKIIKCSDRTHEDLDRREKKRKKLCDNPWPVLKNMPNFLPPDEDVVVNSQNDLAIAIVRAISPTDAPEVDDVITDSFDAAGESATIPVFPLETDDSFGITSPGVPVKEDHPVDELDVMAEMQSLKTRAHLASRKKGLCLVCGERVQDLPDHLDKTHTEEDVQAVNDACFFCHQKFHTNKPQRSLATHLSIVHPAKATVPDEATGAAALEFMQRTGFLNYKCAECVFIFPTKPLLDLHMFTHNSALVDRPERKCPGCPFVGETFAGLVKHTVQHRAKRKGGKIPCPLCGVGVVGSPRGHMEKHHPEALDMIVEKWKLECPECRKKFDQSGALGQHVHERHKGWQCVYCGYSDWKGWQGFHEHIATHMEEKALPCLLCDLSFKEYWKLCVHIRDCHGADATEYADTVAGNDAIPTPKSVPPELVERAIELMRETEVFYCSCRECRRSFVSFDVLDLHQLQHEPPGSWDGDPRRQCPACAFHAGSCAELVQHTAQHRLNRFDAHPCLICGETVKRMRGHVAEKHPAEMQRITENWEFQCPDCDYKFKNRGTMEIHIKSLHKGFQCWYCAKVFYNSKQIGSHVMVHSVNGRYPCPACEKVFPRYPLFNNHYRKCHDATRTKKCSLCPMVFCGEDDLDDHMTTCHDAAVDKTGTKTKKPAAGKTAAKTEKPGTTSTSLCDVCGERFKNYFNMYYHKITVHLGRNPNLKQKPKVRTQCDECQQLFASALTLMTHKKWVHLGVCREKDRKMRLRAERKAAGIPNPRYVKPRDRIAYEDFKHKCEECRLGYAWAISLLKHNESRHPEKIIQQTSISQ